MGDVQRRLESLGLSLPPALRPPPGVRLPFESVRLFGDRAVISGHGPQNPDGSIGGRLGRVGLDLDIADGYESARLTALSMLGSLHRALGDLDRIQAWVRIFGMVRGVPDFDQQPAVINGCSDLILEVFGPEVGAHARSAVGMAELPFGLPVEIEAEVVIRS
ncbi:enamine deaminase RidA (YjgF/YER057c/UK114 family) [Micromonospora pisi]|uniref:Enamine deaminase RidA (YjgF/YER057c/UK114 family) n=1 Tax=Micromonospora pisi TaxID=589240 RepID=A0A495JG41_9ACTN|nr:RidA family protein [Micromonospora pisi]RKR87853.1 enamine deaminase RidA (YjgF/YER057c/UK114 family) [Micromonospora pisi]